MAGGRGASKVWPFGPENRPVSAVQVLTRKNQSCAASARAQENIIMQNYPRSIKTALNRLAHAEGLAYEEAVKRRLLADLERLRGNGATHAEMLAHLQAQEAGGRSNL